eukprot:gnl/Dysnectes_brevis/925_a1027_2154.p1 GENE.gnl/Dysnectes_brevis/925_a1027_2154~~gnl/Dysnectes_brevis/925_a1027_2154.p1  ORF type:complete len:336 (+),score=92.65 gnl/Dysnectes_brevis/925_a1027_2154:747-1754(+)
MYSLVTPEDFWNLVHLIPTSLKSVLHMDKEPETAVIQTNPDTQEPVTEDVVSQPKYESQLFVDHIGDQKFSSQEAALGKLFEYFKHCEFTNPIYSNQNNARISCKFRKCHFSIRLNCRLAPGASWKERRPKLFFGFKVFALKNPELHQHTLECQKARDFLTTYQSDLPIVKATIKSAVQNSTHINTIIEEFSHPSEIPSTSTQGGVGSVTRPAIPKQYWPQIRRMVKRERTNLYIQRRKKKADQAAQAAFEEQREQMEQDAAEAAASTAAADAEVAQMKASIEAEDMMEEAAAAAAAVSGTSPSSDVVRPPDAPAEAAVVHAPVPVPAPVEELAK